MGAERSACLLELGSSEGIGLEEEGGYLTLSGLAAAFTRDWLISPGSGAQGLKFGFTMSAIIFVEWHRYLLSN